jgi:hypothetical protein
MSDMFSPEAVHVAVDIETLGTRPGSVILEIGAKAFTLQDCSIPFARDEFDCYINPDRSMDVGFTTDESTVAWWEQQDTGLWEMVNSGDTYPEDALEYFSEFLASLGPKENIYVWANSPSFDLTLLREYYLEMGHTEIPWDFRNERDFRTLKAMFPARYEQAKALYKNDRQHNGLQDAIWEAAVIKFILSGDNV